MSFMYGKIKDNAFWLKQKLFRRNILNIYEHSLANEKLDKDSLNEINWIKRKKIVEYAYNNVEYYKEKYDEAGFSPEDLKNENDWAKVPILEKQDIRTNFKKLLVKNITQKHLIKTTTGGSTGEPLMTYRDKRFPEEIIKWRMLRRWGVNPGDDIAMLWRIPGKANTAAYKLLNKLIWFPTKRIKIDASSLNESDFEYLYEEIKKSSQIYIWGYVGAIEQFALWLKRKGLELNNISLVWATAAPVSELQKKLFKEVFNTKVLNQYAFSEIHFVAASCPICNNLLVDSDYRHIDIINEKGLECGVNELGDLLVTDLENKVFPLIKYRVGDKSKFTNHNCNKAYPFPTIAPVMGRISDVLKVPDGSSLNGEYLTTVFDDYTDCIQKFQFYQHSNYVVDIKVVSNCTEDITNNILGKVISNLREKTVNQIEFNKYVVDELTSDRGKIRFIKSELS